jgi:Hydrolytic ATP binding site of dynein motor region
MMVPDFQMIMKVKLCSVGYEQFEMLSQKFFVLYNTSKEQLSAQKHYDWGTCVYVCVSVLVFMLFDFFPFVVCVCVCVCVC